MSLLAELFEGLETSTAGVDTLKTERIRATDPAPRFHHSQNVAATMSSREIAELTGKRHDHVMRDIRNMLAELKITDPSFGGSYQDSQNRQQSEYLLDEEHTLCLTSGYDVAQHDGEPQHLIHTAATATLEWIAARDQYVSHLMACCACYAPNGRYCAAGLELRQRYEQTPWERQP